MWHTDSGLEKGPLPSSSDAKSVRFSKNNDYLLTLNDNGTSIWNLDSEQVEVRLEDVFFVDSVGGVQFGSGKTSGNALC